MQRISAHTHTVLSFGSRRRNNGAFTALGRMVRRWRIHARLEAMAASLSDLEFNPFLFQIESSR
jgi:hypothetical protein